MSEADLEPAPARLLQMVLGAWVSKAISTAAELGVADEMAAGPRPVEDLAKAVDADPPTLYRLMRALASAGVFTELDGRCFALTDMGELLRRDIPGSQRAFPIFVNRLYHHEAWSDLAGSVRTGESAFERVHGQSMWDYLAANPSEAEIFSEAMTSVVSGLIPSLVGSYDYSSFGTIVDVGGGHGSLLGAILTANPGVRGVLFDMPHVVADGERSLASLADRCTFTGGDFLQSVPRGGDAYVMSNIIHDWDDDRATVILRNCRDAMNAGGRVLLCEWVLNDGPGNAPVPLWADLEMLTSTASGKQRTEAEFADLLQGAGLRLTRVCPVSPDGLGIVEGVPA